jgi:adenine deaminase
LNPPPDAIADQGARVFDGLVSENMIECQRALDLSIDQIVTLARNSIEAAFVSADEAAGMRARLDAYVAAGGL